MKYDIQSMKDRLVRNEFLANEETESADAELVQEFESRGGMSTEDLIIRLGAVPFDDFQNGLKEKIQNFDKEQ